MIDGRAIPFRATIREMTNGTFHYDLSVGSEARDFSSPTVLDGSETSALQRDLAEWNLASAEPAVNGGDPIITPRRAQVINTAAREALAAAGLLGKIGLRVEAGPLVGPNGSYSGGIISILRDRGKGWRHTLDHEIVHALRDPARWGGSHGLFTSDEWRALVRAARGDADIRSRVERA